MSISAQSCGDFTPSEGSVYYASRAPKVRQHGHEWRGPCPIHSGTGNNFSVNAETGMWYCHSQCGRGGSMFDLEMELTNTDFPPAANEVRRIVGRPALRQVPVHHAQKPSSEDGLQSSVVSLQNQASKAQGLSYRLSDDWPTDD